MLQGNFYIPKSTELKVHKIGEELENIVKNLLESSGFNVINIEKEVYSYVNELLERGYNYQDAVRKAVEEIRTLYNLSVPYGQAMRHRVPDIFVSFRGFKRYYAIEITGSSKYYLRNSLHGERKSHIVHIESQKKNYFSFYPYNVYLLSYYADYTYNLMSMREMVLFQGVVLRDYYVPYDNIIETEFSFQVPTNVFKPIPFMFIEDSQNDSHIVIRQYMSDDYTVSNITGVYIFHKDSLVNFIDLSKTPIKIDIDIDEANLDCFKFLRDLIEVTGMLERKFAENSLIVIPSDFSHRDALNFASKVNDALLHIYDFKEPYKFEFYKELNESQIATALTIVKRNKVIVKISLNRDKKYVTESWTIIYDPDVVLEDVKLFDDPISENTTILTDSPDDVFDSLDTILGNI